MLIYTTKWRNQISDPESCCCSGPTRNIFREQKRTSYMDNTLASFSHNTLIHITPPLRWPLKKFPGVSTPQTKEGSTPHSFSGTWDLWGPTDRYPYIIESPPMYHGWGGRNLCGMVSPLSQIWHNLQVHRLCQLSVHGPVPDWNGALQYDVWHHQLYHCSWPQCRSLWALHFPKHRCGHPPNPQ